MAKYHGGRPTIGQERRVPTSFTLEPRLLVEIERLAAEQGTTRSIIVSAILSRALGLELK